MITTTTRIEADSITITTMVPIDAVTSPIDIGALKALAVKELGEKLAEPAILEDRGPVNEAGETARELNEAGTAASNARRKK